MIFARFLHGFMTPGLTVLISVLLDRVFGEVRRWHPIIGFGTLATRIETIFYPGADSKEPVQKVRWRGALATLLAVAPFTLLAAALQDLPALGKSIEILILYLAIGCNSLIQHALDVSVALATGDLPEARLRVSKIVSRDTAAMNEADIIRATIESVLENGNDAVFAPIFWYIFFGAPGVVLYRLTNTLDAIWGHKNERYLYFGWAAARLDDLLNWIPARLTALTYTLLGKKLSAWQCWQNQGSLWYSPNAGPVMAAGAGALQVEVGGPAFYHGRRKERPALGTGRAPELKDIDGAVNLVQYGMLAWVAFFVLEGFIHV